MKNIKSALNSPLLITFLTTFAMTQHSQALEIMSGAQLHLICEKGLQLESSAEKSACDAYINGYVSASPTVRITDKAEMTFTEQAMATRGSSVSPGIAALKNARYCLPNNTDSRELAQRIVQEAGDAYRGAATSLMQQVLKSHYPC